MNMWLKKVIGYIIIVYIAWLAHNIVYGTVLQVTYFLSDDFIPELFRITMYMYVGSWMTFVVFIISGVFCVRACLTYTNGAKNLILAGIFGLMGYVFGYIASLINRQRIFIPSVYMLTPMYVLIVGILSRNRSPENTVYIPAFIGNRECLMIIWDKVKRTVKAIIEARRICPRHYDEDD